MELLFAAALLVCGLASGSAAGAGDSSVFVLEPQDARVRPGGTVQLDCELTITSQGDICAWRIAGTQLGVDHFYNVEPPPHVRALFPDHERVCSLLVEDADYRHDGEWTCWPLADTSHVSSRTARLRVSDETTLAPTSSAGTTAVTSPEPSPTTTSPDVTSPDVTSPDVTSPDVTSPAVTSPDVTSPEPPRTTQELSTSRAPPTSAAPTTEAPPTSLAPTTEAPSTSVPHTTEAASTTAATTTKPSPTTTARPPTTASPTSSPGFVCPQPYGLFADPANPRYFYYCEDNSPVHMQCDWPKLWDDAQKSCA